MRRVLLAILILGLFAAPAGAAGLVEGAGGGESSPGRSSAQSEGANEEVDLDALARAHIEELLQSEPERVSALLSRWALSEERFAETSSN